MRARRVSREVRFAGRRVELTGDWTVPPGAGGVVLFAHGSGSGRQSPRNRFVAEEPFASEDAFADVARTWHGLGFDELVVYADPSFMVPLGQEPLERTGRGAEHDHLRARAPRERVGQLPRPLARPAAHIPAPVGARR